MTFWSFGDLSETFCKTLPVGSETFRLESRLLSGPIVLLMSTDWQGERFKWIRGVKLRLFRARQSYGSAPGDFVLLEKRFLPWRPTQTRFPYHSTLTTAGHVDDRVRASFTKNQLLLIHSIFFFCWRQRRMMVSEEQFICSEVWSLRFHDHWRFVCLFSSSLPCFSSSLLHYASRPTQDFVWYFAPCHGRRFDSSSFKGTLSRQCASAKTFSLR